MSESGLLFLKGELNLLSVAQIIMQAILVKENEKKYELNSFKTPDFYINTHTKKKLPPYLCQLFTYAALISALEPNQMICN